MKFSPVKRPFNLSLGQRGEMLGWKYLLDNGYKIIEKNFRCKLGEIDVIAEKNSRIVFIEIKTRASKRFGLPQEAVTRIKQEKLIQLAEWYLKQKNLRDPWVSFEVLAISISPDQEPKFLLIENAFSL